MDNLMIALAALVFAMSLVLAGRIRVADFGLLLLGGVALKVWFGVFAGSAFTQAMWESVALVVLAEIGYGVGLAFRGAR